MSSKLDICDESRSKRQVMKGWEGPNTLPIQIDFTLLIQVTWLIFVIENFRWSTVPNWMLRIVIVNVTLNIFCLSFILITWARVDITSYEILVAYYYYTKYKILFRECEYIAMLHNTKNTLIYLFYYLV